MIVTFEKQLFYIKLVSIWFNVFEIKYIRDVPFLSKKLWYVFKNELDKYVLVTNFKIYTFDSKKHLFDFIIKKYNNRIYNFNLT